MLKLPTFLLIVIALLTYIACRKIDRQQITEKNVSAIEEKFFNSHRSNDPTEKALVDFIKSKNDKEHFVEKTVSQIGYPYWDKAIILKTAAGSTKGATESTNIVYVPFVRDTEHVVNASLIIRTIPGDTTFRYLCDWQYRDTGTTGISARSQSLLLMTLDKNVFGERLYKITDTAAFGNDSVNRSIRYVNINSSATSRAARQGAVSKTQIWIQITYCYSFWVDQYQGQLHSCAPGASNCNEYVLETDCETYSYWANESGGGGTGGGTGGGNGNGSGGGGGNGSGSGSTPPTCGGVPVSRGMVQQCEPGWVPNLGGGTPLANQNIIDSLQGYPCAQGILAQLPSINDTAKEILKNVFGVDSLVNVVFVADSTLDQNQNAYTQGTSIQYNPTTGYFNIRIRINTWVLKNSSKEFIIKTMFHEAIHAYIDYHWKKYLNGQIDSTTFKQMFPKIWDYKKTPYTNLAQHTEIAHSYVDYIKSIIKSFNSQIADSTNKGISWSGLFETQAWKDLGSDTIQLNRLRIAARRAGHQPK